MNEERIEMNIKLMFLVCFLLGVLVGVGVYLVFVLRPYALHYEISEMTYGETTQESFVVHFSPRIWLRILPDTRVLMRTHLEKESFVYVEVFARDDFESQTKPIAVYVVIEPENGAWSYVSHKSMFYYACVYERYSPRFFRKLPANFG